MLDYNTCVALKAAGFPQIIPAGSGTWAYVPYDDTHIRQFVSAWQYSGESTLGLDGIKEPNSDELIAAIQVRWPYKHLNWYSVIYDVHQRPGNEPSLRAALAALYIALAGGPA